MKDATTHIIRVEALSIGYKGKRSTIVSEDISMQANLGELIAVVGGNGAGKSTLLRTLAKIQPPLKGTITLGADSLDQLSPQKLATKISLVLTAPIATRNLTVEELVAIARQPYTNWLGMLTDRDITVVNAALQQVDIEALRHRKCYELSDGQLQRVMIARALAQDTDIIILDEPTTHLDIYHKAKILKLLKDIASKTKKIVIFSTHEIELALQLCDQMLVMQGNTSVYGTPKALIASRSFHSLFPDDLIDFDAQAQRFTIKE